MTNEVETPRDGHVYVKQALSNEWTVERWLHDVGSYDTQYVATREVAETLACQIAETWSVGAYFLDHGASAPPLELWSARR